MKNAKTLLLMQLMLVMSMGVKAQETQNVQEPQEVKEPQAVQAAVKAINRYATMRNWLIGFFIVEYQQKGKDRAVYGERLLKRLEESLNTRGLNVTLFQNCRLFYTCYPQVADLFQLKIQPTVLAKLESAEGQKRIQPTASVGRTRCLTLCDYGRCAPTSM